MFLIKFQRYAKLDGKISYMSEDKINVVKFSLIVIKIKYPFSARIFNQKKEKSKKNSQHTIEIIYMIEKFRKNQFFHFLMFEEMKKIKTVAPNIEIFFISTIK